MSLAPRSNAMASALSHQRLMALSVALPVHPGGSVAAEGLTLWLRGQSGHRTPSTAQAPQASPFSIKATPSLGATLAGRGREVDGRLGITSRGESAAGQGRTARGTG
jgi:hypothetical protein